MAPWADALYGADGPWWTYRGGVPEFLGAKFSCTKSVCEQFPNVRFIECAMGCDRIVTAPGYVGHGGNSGFQAINLAVQCGAAKLVLLGFDMRLDHGIHWHGPHGEVLNNPGQEHLIRWRKIIDDAADDFASLGIEVINASKVSALTAYPVRPLIEAVR